MVVLPVASSCQARVCFIQLSSSRSLKSSRACAPRDSLRASAACMVQAAFDSRFCSSRVSMRSEFQISERSSTLMSAYSLTISSILTLPSARVSWVRYTAACSCMHFCILRRRSAVLVLPLALRILSRLEIDCSPASEASGLLLSPGLAMSAMRFAQARPNTTMSRSELAPRRLAPCTDAHAASPAAKRPGTTRSGSSLVGLSTSPKWLV
mmetsp:Transcript_22014/g.62561  ORF Transcript_22014/g.62561 Transcript_22014/m.62561 type:complete len:210 (-) Transcript_22014:1124-1753(-)